MLHLIELVTCLASRRKVRRSSREVPLELIVFGSIIWLKIQNFVFSVKPGLPWAPYCNANGTYDVALGMAQQLSLLTAPRVDCSLPIPALAEVRVAIEVLGS